MGKITIGNPLSSLLSFFSGRAPTSLGQPGDDVVPGFSFGKVRRPVDPSIPPSRNFVTHDRRGNPVVHNIDAPPPSLVRRFGNYAKLQNINYDANPGTSQFRGFERSHNYLRLPGKQKINRVFTTLDIETDDYGRPITISALKTAFNKDTGQFEIIDNYQRFYKSRTRDLVKSVETHGLTKKALRRLRRQQHAGYDKTYTPQEEASLKAFLGGSVVIGHNIVDFDLPHLFSKPIYNQTIDTLIAARNQWKGKKNDLDNVFKRLFGKTMEQAGLSHHNSMSDVIATAMIAQKMAVMKGSTGSSLRYVMTHAGVHMAPADEYVDSQVVKGLYTDYNNPGAYMRTGDEIPIKDIISGKGEDVRFEMEYDEDAKKAVLPDGFHYVDDSYGDSDIDEKMLWISALSDTLKGIHKEVQNAGMISQGAKEAYALGNIQRTAQMIRSLSQFESARTIRSELGLLGINNEQEQDLWISRVRKHQAHIQKQRESNRKRNLGESLQNKIEQATWAAEREGDARILQRLEDVDTADPKAVWTALQDINDIKKERDLEMRESAQNAWQAQAVLEEEEKWEHDKARRISKFSKNKILTKADRQALEDASDYEQLSDAMDAAAESSRKWFGVLSGIAQIPMYNFERLEKVFKSEVSGIKGAARGLVPDTLWSPLSRLTDASMNALNYNYANLKMGTHAFSAIAPGVGAAIGSFAGPIGTAVGGAIGGVAGGISQIIGNYQEAKITKWGEGIQNNLNTIGFLQELILMPFRLLRTAIDKVIKGFGMLTSVLKGVAGLVSGSLGGLGGMGNPLTGMTGVDYGNYMQSLSIDQASLLGAGTTNGIYNDFAQQRMKLYTTGQLDTHRLVAASMLGVFDQVYGSRSNEPTALEDMLDQIRASVKNQDDLTKKQTYVLTSMVNPNLTNILQTMETLGVDTVEALKHPRGMFGWSDGEYDAWRPRWQRAQWEYQYASTQFGTSKNVIATNIWNTIGKQLYNGLNKVMYNIANGNWSAAGSSLMGVWGTVKSGAGALWGNAKTMLGLDEDLSFKDFIVGEFADIGISIAKFLRDKALPAIYGVWDNLVNYMIDRVTNFIEFLGTIRLDWKEFKNQVIDGKKSDKPWITSILTRGYDWDKPGNGWENSYGSTSNIEAQRDAVRNHGILGMFGNALLQTEYGSPHGGEGLSASSFEEIVDNIIYGIRTGSTSVVGKKGLVTSNIPTAEEFSDLIYNSTGVRVDLSKVQTGKELLDALQRYSENPYAAQWLHGIFPEVDVRGSTFNKVAHQIQNSSVLHRDTIATGVLNDVINEMEAAKAKVQINIKNNDKDVATVNADSSGGISYTRNNSNVDIVATVGNVAQFALRNTARIVGE